MKTRLRVCWPSKTKLKVLVGTGANVCARWSLTVLRAWVLVGFLLWSAVGMVRVGFFSVSAPVGLVVLGSGRARSGPNTPSQDFKSTTVLYASRDTPYCSGYCQALSYSRPPADLTRSHALCRWHTFRAVKFSCFLGTSASDSVPKTTEC